MGFETPQTIHLEWPAEFSDEEIKILEEAAAIYNTMHNLDQMGMSDTANNLTKNSEELLKQAKEICQSKEGKNYTLETLIENTQKGAENKYQTTN